MEYPNFNEEKILWKQGFKFVVGLDEAGRGPLAGPVVAAAVVFKFKNLKLIENCKLKIENWGVKDSKQLSEKKRQTLYKKLTNCTDIKWSVGIVSEKIIDKINILEATKLAMAQAIESLRHKIDDRQKPDYLLIDGNFTLDTNLKQKSIIKGDQKVISISAASIIAKVTRDRIMQKYHKKYPLYQFDKHKGYPTNLHISVLKKQGPCSIHRKSFRLEW